MNPYDYSPSRAWDSIMGLAPRDPSPYFEYDPLLGDDGVPWADLPPRAHGQSLACLGCPGGSQAGCCRNDQWRAMKTPALSPEPRRPGLLARLLRRKP